MPSRPCAEPGCPDFSTYKGRCQRHARQQRKANRSPNNSFYASKRWRMTRRKQLSNESQCEYVDEGQRCKLLAVHVHHRKPIEDGGDRYAFVNLMSLCPAHHSHIHRVGEGLAA